VQRKQGIDEIGRFGRGVKSFAGPVFILFGRALLAALALTPAHESYQTWSSFLEGCSVTK
jgi:hypothetical protein